MTDVTVIDAALVKQARDAKALATTYVILTPEMRDAASIDRQRIKGIRKVLEEKRLAISRHYEALSQQEQAPYREPLAFCDKADLTLAQHMLRWDAEQDRLRAQARAIADAAAAAARQKANEEAAAKLAEEEKQRQAAAAAELAKDDAKEKLETAIADGDTDKAVAAAQAINGADAAIATATKAAEQASTQASLAIESSHAMVMAAPLIPDAPKHKGEARRFNYSGEVYDFKELCRAIAAGEIQSQYAEPCTMAINGLARALKEGFNLPGCRLVKTPILASKAIAPPPVEKELHGTASD